MNVLLFARPSRLIGARASATRAVCIVAAIGALASCGARSTTALPDPGAPSDDGVPTGGACDVTLESAAVTSALHVPQGSTLTFTTNPPCGGDHYPVWVVWGAHTTALPRGNWIHNLEHGGVVFSYRCASRDACPALAAQLEAIAAALPQDPLCTGDGVQARIVVVPDPLLPEGTSVAAVSWGHILRATCVDADAMRKFYLAHFGQGSESLCAQGGVSD